MKVCVGNTGVNNRGTKFEVVEYVNANNVTIKFLDGNNFKRVVKACDIKLGKVGNGYDRTKCGVGYLGDGKYNTSDCGKPTLAHISWSSMIKRCYSEQSKKHNPSYNGVRVCEEWLCFDNYAEWFYQQKGWDKGFQLDKDILGKGVKLYSPQTCCLVPREINTAVKYGYVNEKGLPAGVSVSTVGRYISSLNIQKIKTHTGVYDTPEEASAAYVKAKEGYIHSLAEKWKGKIEERAYQALKSWTVYP